VITPEKYKTLNIIKSDEYDAIEYSIFKSLCDYEYNGRSFYLRIKDAFLHMLKKVHSKKGNWKRNPHPLSEETDYGVVINDKWDRLMTLDTNASGQLNLFRHCNMYLESLRKQNLQTYVLSNGYRIKTERIFINNQWKNDVDKTYQKLKVLLSIIDHHSDTWLDRGNEICEETMDICHSKMIYGETAERLFEIHDNLFFPNCDFKYSTGLGDPLDRRTGVDVWIQDDEVIKTGQIKYDNYQIGDDYLVTKAYFSKNSKCNYFIIVHNSRIVLLSNNEKKEKRDYLWYIDKNEIIIELKIIDMFEELKEIMRIVGKHNIQLEITKDGEVNKISYDPENKTLVINFPNHDDKEVANLLKTEIENLNQRFK
jgi:hypothetical protein